MAVEVLGSYEVDGYSDAKDAFLTAHVQNTRDILNVAAGRKKGTPLPKYDPDDPINRFPAMIYHPEKGERIVYNAKEKKDALATGGYRTEPYLKPQIAVLDPAVEKAAMVAKQNELQGQIVQLNDMVQRLIAGQKVEK